MAQHDTIETIVDLFATRGDSQYGGEAVTQREHALQAATLAEARGAGAGMITAALLHDIGHLLHDLPEDAPSHGVDDVHEELGYVWLKDRFPTLVADAVRMHVDAKRYLCAVEADYAMSLSPTSLHSMRLQGGPFTADEARAFEQRPYFNEGVQLRRWDDEAKVRDLDTPPIEHFVQYVREVVN